jgi:hypothetical protein
MEYYARLEPFVLQRVNQNNSGALWQGFSKCFCIGFYRSPAKPLTK